MFPEPEPAPPSFGKVRLATLADLPRIASVASAGFFWSPSFQFQRPYHANYPDDTLSSYCTLVPSVRACLTPCGMIA